MHSHRNEKRGINKRSSIGGSCYNDHESKGGLCHALNPQSTLKEELLEKSKTRDQVERRDWAVREKGRSWGGLPHLLKKTMKKVPFGDKRQGRLLREREKGVVLYEGRRKDSGRIYSRAKGP